MLCINCTTSRLYVGDTEIGKFMYRVLNLDTSENGCIFKMSKSTRIQVITQLVAKRHSCDVKYTSIFI